jgi:hypothetical protein
MKDSIGMREFYLTINEDVCAMAIVSNPEAAFGIYNPKRSGLDCAEKTYSVDCCKIVVSLDFLFTFLSRKLRSNQRGKKQ